MAFLFNAILDFKSDAAVAGMKRAQGGMAGMKTAIQNAGQSLGKVNEGIRGGAVALAPLTAGFGLAIREAGTFEQGLDAVQAVMLASDEQMRPLSQLTKQLGAATKFSALEATEGAKFLAQAGFDVTQVMSALPGVLSAAAASGTDLGTTADIVASTLGSFGMKADEAVKVADTLALGSSLTNTDMVGLGEGLKYAASSAAGARMSMADTVSVLGVLANAGLKGSSGGTALSNALLQLTKPSEEVLGLFGGQSGLNAAIKDGTGNLLPFEAMMANVVKITQKAPDPLAAMGQAAQIFGLRGAKAFNAFAMQVEETVTVNDVMIERFKEAGVDVEKEGIKIGGIIPKLVAIRLQMNGAKGAAAEMAKIQMGNFFGQIEQLSGAIEGLGIEIGGLLLGNLSGMTTKAADAVSILVAGFQALNMTEEEQTKMLSAMGDENNVMFNQYASFLPMMKDFAGGFKEGIASVITGFKSVFEGAKEYLGPIFGDDGFNAKEIGKVAAQIVLIGAVIAPVLGSIAAAAFVLGPLFTGISGIFGLIGAGFGFLSGAVSVVGGLVATIAGAVGIAIGPFLLIAAAIIGAIALVYIFRKEIMDFAFGVSDALDDVGISILLMFDDVEKYAVNTFMGLSSTVSNFFVIAMAKATDLLKEGGLGFLSILRAVGDSMFSIVTAPFQSIMGFIRSTLGSIIDNVPSFILEKAGFSVESLKKIIGIEVGATVNPDISSNDGLDQLRNANRQVSTESTSQSVLSQPPSADAIASILSGQAPISSNVGDKQQAPINVRVQIEGRVSGNDLNLVQTRSQIEQTQLNGRTVSNPIAKRRAVQNGAQFAAE